MLDPRVPEHDFHVLQAGWPVSAGRTVVEANRVVSEALQAQEKHASAPAYFVKVLG